MKYKTEEGATSTITCDHRPMCRESHVVLWSPENTTHVILAKQVAIPPKAYSIL